MKVIGLLGGMSWESSVEYYRVINEEARRRLGGAHSARSVMYTVDFQEIEALQEAGDWEAAARLLIDGAHAVEAAGAECLVICTNTMHRVADEVQAAIGIPLLHIADATAAAVREAGVRSVALLGTRYTMEGDFYRERLAARHGLEVHIPDESGRALVHRVIYEELVRGVIADASRAAILAVVDALITGGAAGVIAGCTEIELLVTPDDLDVPYFPSARIHALAAVDWALGWG